VVASVEILAVHAGRHGAIGLMHDWEIRRQNVVQLRTPVILAGGMTPGNIGTTWPAFALSSPPSALPDRPAVEPVVAAC